MGDNWFSEWVDLDNSITKAFSDIDFTFDGGSMIDGAFDSGVINSDQGGFWSNALNAATEYGGKAMDFLNENPAALKTIGYGAIGAMNYMNQKDQNKAQRERDAKQHEYDMEKLERTNDMQNERYWIKPSGVSNDPGLLAAYGGGWTSAARNPYKQKLTLDDEEV